MADVDDDESGKTPVADNISPESHVNEDEEGTFLLEETSSKEESNDVQDVVNTSTITLDLQKIATSPKPTINDPSEIQKTKGSKNDSFLEVDYLNATSLFKAIEENDWDSVRELIKNAPIEVRTWVCSSAEPNHNSAFTWSVFRKLPIHEACRRQAPLDLVHELVKSYPESVSLKTHFEEMPLHCAIGGGCRDDVLLLLLAHKPNSAMHKDLSGRTPVEILRQRDMLHLDEERIRLAFANCTSCFKEDIKRNENRLRSMSKKQMKQFRAEKHTLEKQMSEEIKKRDDKIATLNSKVEKKKKQMQSILNSLNEVEVTVKSLKNNEVNLLREVAELKKNNAALMQKCTKYERENQHQKYQINEKEDLIKNLINTVGENLEGIQSMIDQNHRSFRASKALEEEQKILVEKQRKLNDKAKKRMDLLRNCAVRTSNDTKKLVGDCPEYSMSNVFQFSFLPGGNQERNSSANNNVPIDGSLISPPSSAPTTPQKSRTKSTQNGTLTPTEASQTLL